MEKSLTKKYYGASMLQLTIRYHLLMMDMVERLPV